MSPIQRPHYITSSYTYLFLKKVIFVPHCSIALCLSLLEFLRLPLAKGSSTFLTKPLFPHGREDVTALRCSEPLRFRVGGPIKGLARFAG